MSADLGDVASGELDCRSCGACCVNLPSNRAQGFGYWVEISGDDKLLGRRDLIKKHVVYDPSGVPHLKLAHDGRCLGLRGEVGTEVTCGIYHSRPTPCRRVEPGDDHCLRSRKAHGIT